MATFLSVTLPTVVNWVNAGRLDCHRTAGGHRRIARADLIAFAREAGMPLPADVLDPDPSRNKRILLIDEAHDYAEGIVDFLRLRPGLDVQLATRAFEAGLAVGRFQPDLIVVSLTMPDLDAEELRLRLAAEDDLRAIVVLGSSPPMPDAERRAAAFDGLLEKPVPLRDLLQEVQARLGLAG